MNINCVFCQMTEVLFENELALAFYDRHPVNQGHLLIVPKRHAETYFDLSQDEKRAIDSLLGQCKDYLDKQYQPDAYNIGLNCGQVAGQTIFHCHLHLIPRYEGDCQDPTGGVRGVIPHKQNY